jgi:ubiquinone/menaquinone biosynthesis C-methylase UbiE
MRLGDFSAQAESYRSSRPTYPDSLIEALVADAGIAVGDAVIDFGAGTGILTRLLVQRGFAVTAVEPNEQMRTQAEVPEARWTNGTFENSTLPDASQRWAVAAQAFHWADPKRALPEIRRVLEPDRLFTILWNRRENGESEVLAWTQQAIRRHLPDFDEAYRDKPWRAILESTGDFEFYNERSVAHVVQMSRERYLNLWRSHNRLNTIAGPDRFAAFMAELTDYLDRHSLESIDVPYRCEAWSARRQP